MENTQNEFFEKKFKQFIERQTANMMLYQQIDEQGNLLVNVSYKKLFDEEEEELRNAKTKIDKLDALCDMVVCLCGAVVVNQVGYSDANMMFDVICMHATHKFPRFFDAVNEVFDNNKRRIQYNEDGSVKLFPQFLEDGTPHPKAGKVDRNNSQPNLEQFLI